MATYVYYQFYVFLSTFYGGVLIGLIYDFYRVFRRYMKPSKKATVIQDLLFWIVVSIIAFFVLLYSNDGVIRGFTILGFFIGALAYNRLLSRFVLRGMIWTVDGIIKGIKTLISWVLKPIQLLIKTMKNIIIKGKKTASACYQKAERKIEKGTQKLFLRKK